MIYLVCHGSHIAPLLVPVWLNCPKLQNEWPCKLGDFVFSRSSVVCFHSLTKGIFTNYVTKMIFRLPGNEWPTGRFCTSSVFWIWPTANGWKFKLFTKHLFFTQTNKHLVKRKLRNSKTVTHPLKWNSFRCSSAMTMARERNLLILPKQGGPNSFPPLLVHQWEGTAWVNCLLSSFCPCLPLRHHMMCCSSIRNGQIF